MATVGKKLRSVVDAYNDSIPGLDRFIIAKSRKLKSLGSAKGEDAEHPEAIEVQPKLFSSQELRRINSLLEGEDEES